jgi:hypothetical protein
MDAHRRLLTVATTGGGSRPVPIARWIADGHVFRRPDGTAERYRGLSQFRLLDRFARGDDISWVRKTFPASANVCRVWTYVEWDPPATWTYPPNDVVVDFLRAMAGQGFRVELTLMTSDYEHRYPPMLDLAEYLAAEDPDNLVIEIGNEPLTNKRIQVERFYPILDASSLVWSSGIYEDESFMPSGHYIAHHSARTFDWPRRAHDALEFWNGDGPSKKHPPFKMPCALDEPGKPEDAPGDRAQKIRDFRAYGGASAIMGCGATFHSNSGKNSTAPGSPEQWPITDEEIDCATALFEGLDAFADDAPLGPYRRIVEAGQPDHARTYVVGPCMVRCQQNGTAAPEPGWTPIDADGVLFRK